MSRSDDFLDEAEKPANAGVFNLNIEQLAAWREQKTLVSGLIDERDALKSQLEGMNAEIKAEGATLETLARQGLGVAAKSPAPVELKTEAGVTVAKPRTRSAPKVPSDLVATANVNGTAFLKWKRNGNISTAKFVVEKRVGTGEWFLVDVVTTVSLTVQAKVGEQASFRVSARNGQGTSLPGNDAVIYDA